ncbi:TonB-dependent receptor plug domain-containing protein [Primorskyibacter marinus]|uniref:TonB-dependent receptor plug domain-containing protein n=1 Tax=Primorskyibacter marinus TaxID=1977320 RepID=UPI000E30A44F|nr:TonB-dependent receptor [Primorskyibacter marinus]
MKQTLAPASLLAVGLALPAMAQDYTLLDTITVYANQTPTELSSSGATVDVVTQADLRASGTSRLADALDTLPGVAVSNSGGLGGTSTVRVRGLSGAYVPVYVNGIDVTDPSSTQTQFDWANISMSNISRVELVKGSQSAVHGSEAIGGVINVTTKGADVEGTQIDVATEVGAYDTIRSSVNVANRSESGGLYFGLSRVRTDGFSAREGAFFTEDDAFEGTQLTFGADYDVTGTLRVGLDAFAIDSTADFDTFTEDGVAETRTRALRAWAELTTGAVDHTLSASRFEIDRLSTADGFADPFEGTRERIDYMASWQATDALTLSAGVDWTRETSFSTGGLFDPITFARTGSITSDSDSTISGIFTEALWAPRGDLDLSFSVRHDDHSRFGGHTSARAALAWRPTEDITVRALASNGFRAPSLYELFDAQYGNADLSEETSRNYELGIEKTYAGGAFVGAAAFYTEVDDLIVFGFPTYQQSSGTSVTRGLELSGGLPVTDRIFLTGNYTLTDSRDANDDPQLRVPRHDLVLGLDAEITDRLSGGLTVQKIADRPSEFGTEMDDYTLINATLGYVISDTAEAYLRIENLGDADYQTVGGFSTSGRAAYVGIRASF